MRIERFAPSPTGLLHLGHAFSALTAWKAAKSNDGRFLLRIEDTDTQRCKPEFTDAIYDDLKWLGMGWEQPVLLQSTRGDAYKESLRYLSELDLTYACRCTRSQIATIADTEFVGPEGIIYPGTCRDRSEDTAKSAIRLDLQAAIEHLGGSKAVDSMTFQDTGIERSLSTDTLINSLGDVVLWRKDTQTAAYHLAVVVDDAMQEISHVTRGQDVAFSTPLHRLLQALLDLPTPIYHHHQLITDSDGKRLAKIHNSKALRTFRDQGVTPKQIKEMIDFTP